MNVKRLMPGLVCVAFLSACATTDPSTSARSHATMADSMAAAEAQVKAGKAESAMEILRALETVATARRERERLELRTASGALAATLKSTSGSKP